MTGATGDASSVTMRAHSSEDSERARRDARFNYHHYLHHHFGSRLRSAALLMMLDAGWAGSESSEEVDGAGSGNFQRWWQERVVYARWLSGELYPEAGAAAAEWVGALLALGSVGAALEHESVSASNWVGVRGPCIGVEGDAARFAVPRQVVMAGGRRVCCVLAGAGGAPLYVGVEVGPEVSDEHHQATASESGWSACTAVYRWLEHVSQLLHLYCGPSVLGMHDGADRNKNDHCDAERAADERRRRRRRRRERVASALHRVPVTALPYAPRRVVAWSTALDALIEAAATAALSSEKPATAALAKRGIPTSTLPVAIRTHGEALVVRDAADQALGLYLDVLEAIPVASQASGASGDDGNDVLSVCCRWCWLRGGWHDVLALLGSRCKVAIAAPFAWTDSTRCLDDQAPDRDRAVSPARRRASHDDHRPRLSLSQPRRFFSRRQSVDAPAGDDHDMADAPENGLRHLIPHQHQRDAIQTAITAIAREIDRSIDHTQVRGMQRMSYSCT